MSTEENTMTTADRGAPEPEASGDDERAPATAAAADAITELAPQTEAAVAAPAADEAEAAPAAPAAPAPTTAAVSAADEDEDWGEQPGDDIGNRLPGAGPRDDIGNRRGGGRGAPAVKHEAHGPARHDARGPAKHDARAPRAAQAPAPEPVAAPDAAAAPVLATDATATTEEGAAGPAKKRRRRRRRKPGAAGAQAGQAGVEGEAAEGDAATADGAEGSDEAGDDEGAEAGAEGEHAEGAEPGEGAGKRDRKKRGRGGPPPRERPAFGVGEEVFGKVARVTDDAVWIDIAGKAMGLFDRRELGETETPAEGDQFLATVASNGVRGGMLMLSQQPAAIEQSREKVEAAAKNGDLVEGFVTGAVKGGLEVDLGGLRAFAPASHVDLRHGADLSYLVGQRHDFHVAQYAKKGRDIVVSRKKMLEEDSRRARTEALKSIEPGSVHMGIVRTVVQWGAFIALPEAGGVEGLVHMTEASHDRGAKLADIFKPGAEIEVKVIRVDDKGKLWLSRRAVESDPWDAVKQKYAVGSRHKGKIARLQPFGAFIELEPGVDGLCHTADLSLKPIEHPSEVVKIGDEIEVVVASCDGASHKIGLHPAPPAGEEDEPRQRVQQYKSVKVAVVQQIEGGLVVRILGVTGRSARAFIPANHTGTPRGADLRKDFPVGMKLETKVLEIDPRRGEAKLSIRALKEDAEKQAYQQYRAGVARDSKFGTFADLLKKS